MLPKNKSLTQTTLSMSPPASTPPHACRCICVCVCVRSRWTQQISVIAWRYECHKCQLNNTKTLKYIHYNHWHAHRHSKTYVQLLRVHAWQRMNLTFKIFVWHKWHLQECRHSMYTIIRYAMSVQALIMCVRLVLCDIAPKPY